MPDSSHRNLYQRYTPSPQHGLVQNTFLMPHHFDQSLFWISPCCGESVWPSGLVARPMKAREDMCLGVVQSARLTRSELDLK